MTETNDVRKAQLYKKIFRQLSADELYIAELGFLKTATEELVRNEVGVGDGDLLTKARNVLEMGVKHIAAGKPSPDFLHFVAHSIRNTLNGTEPSLDNAFRLKYKNHRPTEDPLEDVAIRAYIKTKLELGVARFDAITERSAKSADAEREFLQYLRAMDEYSEDESDALLDRLLENLGQEITNPEKAEIQAKRAAIESAYEAKWGASSQDHKDRKIGSETIKARMRSIKDKLRSLDLY